MTKKKKKQKNKHIILYQIWRLIKNAKRKEQNNLNYSPDCDFFFPFFRINSFLKNYFEYQNMNSEDYINVKKGENSFNIKIEKPQLRFR